jgi:hypothetical protein
VLNLATDVDSRVGILVDDGHETREHYFFDYGTTHSLPLLGFKPDRTNVITLTVFDRQRNAITADQPIIFVTDPLPNDFPDLLLLQTDPAAMEPGYSLFIVNVFGAPGSTSQYYAVIVDAFGQVVWYNTPPPGFDIRQLKNADLFVTSSTNFVEFNLLGQTIESWSAPLLPLDPHDGVPTDHGTILYLNDALEFANNIPTSLANPDAPTTPGNILYQKVVEISVTNAAVLNTWSPIDVLDPVRASYLFELASDGLPDTGWDTEHSNAIIEDPSDDSLIVSMRNQNAVIKFSRASGQLKWILGPHDNWGPQWQPYLLTPAGAPFAWQYGQHSPILTQQGTLILYDDGNVRSSPFDPVNPEVIDADNYSRAVEYRINEQTMEVSQVWEYGSTNAGEWLYTGYMGNAEPEAKTGNVLIDFSAVSYENGLPVNDGDGIMARFKEVTHDPQPQVVFDLEITMFYKTNSAFQNSIVYRVHRIPDLYPHPAEPVADLAVNYDDGVADLAFSADDAWTYVVEASSTLTDWEVIGVASELDSGTGEFGFEDIESGEMPARYYRIVTQ